MQPEFNSSPRAHVVRIVLTLVFVVAGGFLLRPVFLPADFGEYGLYRPAAVSEEAARPPRNLTDTSCFNCHAPIRDLHLAGAHQTITCEGCHGPCADHVRNDRVVARMPVVRGQAMQALCLRCHLQTVRAAPPEMIRMVAVPDHLTALQVRADHTCDQCHHVHAPMKWVHEAREMVGLATGEEDSAPWRN